MTNSQEIENKISILEARHEMFESEIVRVESSHRNQMMIIDFIFTLTIFVVHQQH